MVVYRQNTAHLPEHRACKTLTVNVLSLEFDDVGCVIRNEFLLGEIIRIASDVGRVFEDLCASH